MKRSPKRSQPRGELVVRKVLGVTVERLATLGFERLSIPEVAGLAGVNKTSVYRRWPTKEALVREALSTSMGQPEALPDTGTLRGDLLALARGALRFVESPLGMGVLRTLLAEGAGSGVGEVAATLLHQDTAGPRKVFKRAIARRDIPATVDVGLVLSTVAGALMHRIFVEKAIVTDTYLERLIDLMLFGLKAS